LLHHASDSLSGYERVRQEGCHVPRAERSHSSGQSASQRSRCTRTASAAASVHGADQTNNPGLRRSAVAASCEGRRVEEKACLLRQAVELIFSESGGGRGFIGPLCLVTSGGRAALIDDLASRATAGGWKVICREGETLGREIAAALAGDTWGRLRERFAIAELVAIHQLEAIGGSDQQSALRQLFDASPTAVWCVGVAEHPLATRIAPDLAARITAGLTLSLAAPLDGGDGTQPAGAAAAGSGRPDSGRRRRVSVARIVAVTAGHFDLEPAAVLGPSRSRSLARARSLAMYLARRLTGGSYTVIGRAFGGRDHTTVMHGTRIAAARLAAEQGFAADAKAIEKRLRGDRGSRREAAGRLSIS